MVIPGRRINLALNNFSKITFARERKLRNTLAFQFQPNIQCRREVPRAVAPPPPTTMSDFSDHLPLQLIKSEAIPPAPNLSESAIDWLPDFSGYSWIAYGASSLLVISHFPSPLSQYETLIGPIFRQVFELSSDGSGSVSAVSWSTVTPSLGDLAGSLDNCIGLFEYNNSEFSNG